MSHPVTWSSAIFYYPIGNTPPICLTDRTSPDRQDVKVLLLGCGDPRNILFTLETDCSSLERSFTFTCCDIEPAVLARNVLLFALMVSHPKEADAAWAIFYHFFIDKTTRSLLRQQCAELSSLASSHDTWEAGPYSFVSFCDDQTLTELRRHWDLYIKAIDDSKVHSLLMKEMRRAMGKIREEGSVLRHFSLARASGLAADLALVKSENFDTYWDHGTTFSHQRDIDSASFVNPTFSYSLTGSEFAVHYGTNPLIAFHLAPVFLQVNGGKPGEPSLGSITTVVQSQFRRWVASFRNAIHSKRLSIRLFCGDALSFALSIQAFHQHGVSNASEYTSRWSLTTINLNKRTYTPSSRSSVLFDIIDTSNLVDHTGFMNVLIATSPLLQQSSDAVLFTEALHPKGDDPTQGFLSFICGDLHTISLMLGIVPIDSVAKFTTCSNRHEIMATSASMITGQYHERIAWRSSDMRGSVNPRTRLDFAPKQLASLLFSLYREMFAQENPMYQFSNMSLRNLTQSRLVHYVRGTYAALLRLFQRRVIENTWISSMDALVNLITQDRDILMGMNYFQDFFCHLYRLGVWSPHEVIYGNLSAQNDSLGLFRGWTTIPGITLIILRVPRSSLKVLEEIDPSQIGTPVLTCDTNGAFGYNAVFSSVNVSWGQVDFEGSGEARAFNVREDKAGLRGSSDLIVLFRVLTDILMGSFPRLQTVSFALRATPATVKLVPKLGFQLHLFTAKVNDTNYVNIIKDTPLPQIFDVPTPPSIFTVQLGNEPRPAILSITAKNSIIDNAARESLINDAHVSTSQSNPTETVLEFPAFRQSIIWPIPINHSKERVRIARKSSWIEVILPPGGLSLTSQVPSLRNISPMMVEDRRYLSWNIHYVNLDLLPTLVTPQPGHASLTSHLVLQLSERERQLCQSLQGQTQREELMKEVKITIQTIIAKSVGLQDKSVSQVFAFCDHKQRIYTLLFVAAVRLDLAAHTVVIDAYLLTPVASRKEIPAISSLMRRLSARLGNVVVIQTKLEAEVQAWRCLLPAFVERCRVWKHKDSCPYMTEDAVSFVAPNTSVDEIVDPLCGCGQGQCANEFIKRFPAFKDIAPFVTRAGVSPLFAVSYLEKVVSDDDPVSRNPRTPTSTSRDSNSQGKCSRCGGSGKPQLLRCSRCREVWYCSSECQKLDWKSHKPHCSK